MSVAVHEGARPAPGRGRLPTVGRYRLAAFAYGLGWGFSIPLGGQLYLAEVFALAGLLFLDVGRVVARHPTLRVMLLGYGILLSAQITSDIVNGSAPQDYMRGWASIGFAVFDLVFLVALFERSAKALIWLLVGLGISGIFANEVDLDAVAAIDESHSNFFKQKFLPVVAPLAVALSYWIARGAARNAAIYFIAAGLFFFAMEARSTGLIFLTGGTLLVLSADGRRLPVSKLFLLSLPALALGYLAYRYYVAQTLAGTEMTNSAFQLRLAENPYNPLELLYYGRTEVFIAMEAIVARPFLGHGSWAPDPTGFYSLLWSRIKGYVVFSPYIRAHSVLATAWLWAGIVGFAGILLVFLAGIGRFRTLLAFSHPLKPVIIVLLVEFVWHALFSPFSHIRTSFPPVLAIVVVVLSTLRARQQAPRATSARPSPALIPKPLTGRPNS